jgi:hypothetical protein
MCRCYGKKVLDAVWTVNLHSQSFFYLYQQTTIYFCVCCYSFLNVLATIYYDIDTENTISWMKNG